MKKIWLIGMIAMLFLAAEAKAAFYWRNVGREPLIPQIGDILDLQKKLPAYQDKIMSGFNMAEPSWNAEEVYRAMEVEIMTGRVIDYRLSSNSRAKWMIFGPGQVSVVRDVYWVGGRDLEGFLVDCSFGRFFIPKECGNLCLIEASVAVRPPLSSVPTVVERPVYVDRPVYVEVERPVYVGPALANSYPYIVPGYGPQNYGRQNWWSSWMPRIHLNLNFSRVNVRHRQRFQPNYPSPPRYCPPTGWPGGR